VEHAEASCVCDASPAQAGFFRFGFDNGGGIYLRTGTLAPLSLPSPVEGGRCLRGHLFNKEISCRIKNQEYLTMKANRLLLLFSVLCLSGFFAPTGSDEQIQGFHECSSTWRATFQPGLGPDSRLRGISTGTVGWIWP
jgi:hypothetical protein